MNPDTKILSLPVVHKNESFSRDYLEYQLERAQRLEDHLMRATKALAVVIRFLRATGLPCPLLALLESLLSALHDTRRDARNPLFKISRTNRGLTTDTKVFRSKVAALAEVLVKRKNHDVNSTCRNVATWACVNTAEVIRLAKRLNGYDLKNETCRVEGGSNSNTQNGDSGQETRAAMGEVQK